MRRLLVLAVLAVAWLPLPAAAQSVACDIKVVRMVHNLRHEPMTPEQTERVRAALYAAIEQCRPLTASTPVDRPSSGRHRTGERDGAGPDTRLERQSWRAQQGVLSPGETREGERRLDAIDRKSQSDPRAARDMQRIWEADRALNTLNRPGSGPSLVGPGDRN